MKREFLKLMGLDKLAVNRIMAVYSADVERYKREIDRCANRIRSLEQELDRWETEANRLARELYYGEAAGSPSPEGFPYPPANSRDGGHGRPDGARGCRCAPSDSGAPPQPPRDSEQDDRRKLD